MSNFRAIATVTATLQRALQAAVQSDVPGASVSTVKPAEGSNTNLPSTGINIYLYQVSHNPHRGNDALPLRRPGGDLAQRPQAALDLHYLLSFYGDDLSLEPQRLLGSVIAYMESQPVLTRAQIETAVTDPTKAFLAASDLADQVDLVHFTPLSMSLEELSRLWSVFIQVPYTLSITYKASVVLIERQVTPRPALPVRRFNLASIPLRQPFIRSVTAQAGEGVPITPGSAVFVDGGDLVSAATSVVVDGAAVLPVSVDATRVALTLPAGLSAGPHTIQLRHAVLMPGSEAPRAGFSSNLSSFVLQPVITKTGDAFDITVADVQGTGTAARSGRIVVVVAPDVQKNQMATLEFLGTSDVALTVMASPRADAVSELSFPFSNLPAGDYVLRVRIDGAESPLDLDVNRLPVAPRATIP